MPVLVFGDVLVALVALVVVFGVGLLAFLASHLVPSLPLIGSYLRNAVVGALNGIVSAARTVLNSAAYPMAFLLWGVALTVWLAFYLVDASIGKGIALAQYAYAYAETHLNALAHDVVVADQSLGAEITRVADDLQSNINTLEGVLLTDLGRVAADLQGNINAVDNALDTAIGGVAAGVDWLEQHAVPDLQANINALATQFAAGLSGLAETAAHDLATAIADAEQAAANAEHAAIAASGPIAADAAASAVAALDNAAHDLVIGPWEALIPEVGTIVASLPAPVVAAIPGLEALTRPLDGTVPGILGALAPAIAAVGAEVADCGVPLCRNLSGLSNLFAGLTDAALLGVLLAFLAEAAADPTAAAAEVEGVLGPLVGGATSAVRDLIGV